MAEKNVVESTPEGGAVKRDPRIDARRPSYRDAKRGCCRHGFGEAQTSDMCDACFLLSFPRVG